MASENPDDQSRKKHDPAKDGSKKLHSVYKGVCQSKSTGKWYAQCSKANVERRYIGTYDTELEAALAYDKKARELRGADAYGSLNFPQIPGNNSSLASGVQSVPSGNKGKKKDKVIISQSEIDAARPYYEARKKELAEAKQDVPQPPTDDSSPATPSILPIAAASVGGVANGSEFANFSSQQSLENSVCSEVRTTGSIIGSSRSTTEAIAEPQAATAATDVMLPTATSSTFHIAASTIRGVASRSESANIPSKQPAVMESIVKPAVELQDLENLLSGQLSTADKEFADSFLNQEALDRDFKSS